MHLFYLDKLNPTEQRILCQGGLRKAVVMKEQSIDDYPRGMVAVLKTISAFSLYLNVNRKTTDIFNTTVNQLALKRPYPSIFFSEESVPVMHDNRLLGNVHDRHGLELLHMLANDAFDIRNKMHFEQLASFMGLVVGFDYVEWFMDVYELCPENKPHPNKASLFVF